jgi:uncharacterized membrane protein YgcG
MMLALALSLAVQGSNPPVTVKINHDQFSSGDRARVYVEAAQDGYLVVLHADAAGRIRVLFPIDPRDDDFIRGDKKVEIRGRNDRDAFQVDGDEGSGTVLAAVSRDPLNFDAFVRNDHWDFRALGGPSQTVTDDPLAKLFDIVQRMAGDSSGRFDYDQATYVVRSYRYASRYGNGYGYDDPYHFGIGLSFGYPYRFGYYNAFYDPFCDPFWGCYGGFGYPYSYGFGYGFIYRTRIYRPRPFVFGNFGRQFAATRTLVMPAGRDRVESFPVRPRTERSDPVSIRNRGMDSRAPRVAPRPSSSPRSRPSVSRGGSGGGSRGAPAPRSFGGGRSGGSGGSGGSRGVGGRRH